jgi:hypothetical protein
MKTFYKHTYTIVVLSQEKDEDDLDSISYNVNEGEDCLYSWDRTSIEPLTPKQAAEALNDAGSAPEFFSLDNDGNSIEDE